MKSVNPYRIAASLVWHRFKWELNPVSRRSRSKLQRQKGIHAGEKCIICCNGPSLLQVDFDSISQTRTFCFGLNKINLLLDKTDWKPDAICACNDHVLHQSQAFFNSTDIPLFLDSSGLQWIEERANTTFLPSVQVNRFAENCSQNYVQGSTVTYMALQLAFHMGFTQVALVGCDHSFVANGLPHETLTAGDYDPNHFDPHYFANGASWQVPDLAGSEYFYHLADRHYRESGRMIINCTEGGDLDTFERKSLKNFLGDASPISSFPPTSAN